MAGPTARRPLPAVIFLVALSLLSALVWWRVLHRNDSAGTTAQPSASAKCTPKTTKPIALPKPAAVTVSVLNATTTTGLASSVAGQLKSRGFAIGPVANDTAALTTSEIRYGPASAPAARLVQLYLPGAKLVANASTTPVVVVSIGSTFKALATAAQVAQAGNTATAVPTC